MSFMLLNETVQNYTVSTDFESLASDDKWDDPQTILIIKIVFIFVVFILAEISGIMPAKIKSCGQNVTFMGLANAFSGGLFLAIALYHILPEAVESYNEWYEEKQESDKV